MKGERIKEQVKLLEQRVLRFAHTLQEIQKYPSSYPHLQELPRVDGSIDDFMVWSERRESVGNARVLSGSMNMPQHHRS